MDRVKMSRLSDSLVSYWRKWCRVEIREDARLLRFYRVAYVFANGCLLPKVWFAGGCYHIKHSWAVETRDVTDRQLRRLGVNLVRRGLKQVRVDCDPKHLTVVDLYGYLELVERMVVDGRLEIVQKSG